MAGQATNLAAFSPDPTVVSECITFAACCAAVPGMFTGADTEQPEPTNFTTSLLNLLGADVNTPTNKIAITELRDFENWIHGMSVYEGDTQDPAGNDQYWRYATLVELGDAKMAWRYARLHCLLPAEVPGENSGAQAGQGTPQLASDPSIRAMADHVKALAESTSAMVASSAKDPSAVPLSETVSQTNTAVARKLNKQEVMQAYGRYILQFGSGKKPNEDEEPTVDQLSGIRFLLDNDEPPFVDFAVFKPHGHRHAKKQKFAGTVFNPQGELVHIEIAGPPTFQQFKASLLVLQNSLIMLGAVDLGNLTDYIRLLERYHQMYGDAMYALIYQTDYRARSEHMARLHREAYTEYQAALLQCNGILPPQWP